MSNGNLELLDVLTILSFALQIENQGHIIDIGDIQAEVNRAIEDIHSHLQEQDRKIDRILEALNHENH